MAEKFVYTKEDRDKDYEEQRKKEQVVILELEKKVAEKIQRVKGLTEPIEQIVNLLRNDFILEEGFEGNKSLEELLANREVLGAYKKYLENNFALIEAHETLNEIDKVLNAEMDERGLDSIASRLPKVVAKLLTPFALTGIASQALAQGFDPVADAASRLVGPHPLAGSVLGASILSLLLAIGCVIFYFRRRNPTPPDLRHIAQESTGHLQREVVVPKAELMRRYSEQMAGDLERILNGLLNRLEKLRNNVIRGEIKLNDGSTLQIDDIVANVEDLLRSLQSEINPQNLQAVMGSINNIIEQIGRSNNITLMEIANAVRREIGMVERGVIQTQNLQTSHYYREVSNFETQGRLLWRGGVGLAISSAILYFIHLWLSIPIFPLHPYAQASEVLESQTKFTRELGKSTIETAKLETTLAIIDEKEFRDGLKKIIEESILLESETEREKVRERYLNEAIERAEKETEFNETVRELIRSQVENIIARKIKELVGDATEREHVAARLAQIVKENKLYGQTMIELAVEITSKLDKLLEERGIEPTKRNEIIREVTLRLGKGLDDINKLILEITKKMIESTHGEKPN
ncbi:MAG: hypothetical protein NZ822_03310 [Patescibacteria group bacterium]|nr:hypothetical protein [Patescibacteria group bacterium]